MKDYDDYLWFKCDESWFEVFRILSKSELDRLFTAIEAYITDNEIPELPGAERVAFALMKKDLTKDRDRVRKIKNSIQKLGESKYIRNSKEYSCWRKQVFERDEYTCQICGKRGGKLNAHHKVRFADCPEKRLDIDNGITLCESCHKQVHHLKIIIE